MQRAILLLALVGASILGSCTAAPTKPHWPVQTNRAAAAKSAEKVTPAVKRYRDAVENRIGAIWYWLVKANVDRLSIGTVTLTFVIPAAGGNVRDIRITCNTAGKMDALIAVRAVSHIAAPRIPREVLAESGKDYIDFEESFTIFPNP